MKRIVLYAAIFITFIISGCGGGGGDNTVTPVPLVLSPWTCLLGHDSNNTMGNAVAMDRDGNSYATGETTGQLDPARTGGIQDDVFVVKYDKDGVKKWVKQMGVEAKRTYGCGVAADADGNSYVTGHTTANLVIGSGSSTGLKDVFVAKNNTSGVLQWVKQLGVTDKNTLGFGIAIDAAGNSYITGYTGANLVAGSGDSTGTIDIFIAKYDKNGVQKWVQQLGAAGFATVGQGIAVDQDGDCYVTGRTEGGLGGNTLSGSGSTDVFVLKYNKDGDLKWVKQKGVSGTSTYGWGIAVDASGNSYVTGSTQGDLDGAGPGILVGNPDVFVMKYNTSGDLQWLKQTSAAGCYAEGKSIALDSEGNCFAAGNTNADLDGAGPGVFTGSINIFVMAYDKDGTSLWSRQMGSDIDSDDMTANGIAVSTGGTCLVAGYVDEAFDGEVFNGLWSDCYVTTKLND